MLQRLPEWQQGKPGSQTCLEVVSYAPAERRRRKATQWPGGRWPAVAPGREPGLGWADLGIAGPQGPHTPAGGTGSWDVKTRAPPSGVDTHGEWTHYVQMFTWETVQLEDSLTDSCTLCPWANT